MKNLRIILALVAIAFVPMALSAQSLSWSGKVDSGRVVRGIGLDLMKGGEAASGAADLRIDGRTLVSDRSALALTPGRTLNAADTPPGAGYSRSLRIDDLPRMLVFVRLPSGQFARVKVDEKAADTNGYIALYIRYELSK
jgi:hypothetical protein